MRAYLNLLQQVRDFGDITKNRTGIDTISIPSAMLQFNMADGFPAMTTKALAFDQVKGELIGFLRGCTSAAEFRALGCNVWNANANKDGKDQQGNVVPNKWLTNPFRKGEDDLGVIYGSQWREWNADQNGNYEAPIDQIANVLHTLRTDPSNRRMLVSAWNPAQLDQMALPPCHVLFKLMANPDTKILHLSYYQRSCDMFLGVPFNVASYALLLELFAGWCGYRAGMLTAHMDDVHIYSNHFKQVDEQLDRSTFPSPRLGLTLPIRAQEQTLDFLLEHLQPDCIELIDYQSHEKILAPMAV